jgi:hypothetical protein
MKSLLVLLATALLVPAHAALAQVAAVVDGVQMPAWVERAGRRIPLIPGMSLQAGDQIVTGAGSRVMVKLAEGSAVKLGENGQLRFAEISPTRELFKAALDVLEGAFRFTTDVVEKGRKRDVTVRAAQVTAGIRGTDFWGRSKKDNEIICLIEGDIRVAAQGEPPVTMNQPRQFYRRIDGKTQPVGVVDQAQIDKWSAETDLQTGKGVARRGGRAALELGRFDQRNAALAMRDQVREAGYPAVVLPIRSAYAVRIRSLASRADAQALANQLRGKYGISEPKVSG